MSKQNESEKIFGYDWELLLRVQRKQARLHSPIPARAEGADYGSDPMGDGTFRMVPSGDIVSFEERNKRLKATK